MLNLKKIILLGFVTIVMGSNISFAEKVSMPYLYNNTNYIRIYEDSWAAYYLLNDSVTITPLNGLNITPRGDGQASVLYDIFASSIDGDKIRYSINIIWIDPNNQNNSTFYYRDAGKWREVDNNMDKVDIEACKVIIGNFHYNDCIRNGKGRKGKRYAEIKWESATERN